MKGCALRTIVGFLGWPAVAVVVSLVLTEGFSVPRDDTYGVAALAGLVGWIGLALVNAARASWRERAGILNGLSGQVPLDGRPTVLVGHIEPEGASLRAPFSAVECVAYSFEIFQMLGTGRQSRRAVYYDGMALVPSQIVTRSGSYRLLAVPELDCEEADLSRPQALANAVRFVETTAFEAPTPAFGESALAKRWSDTDGAYRREVRHVTADIDLEPCQLSERHLARGARVSVFGRYSAEKRAIVANADDWSQITRIMLGDPDATVRQLRSRAIFRLVLGLIFVGGATAIAASALKT